MGALGARGLATMPPAGGVDVRVGVGAKPRRASSVPQSACVHAAASRSALTISSPGLMGAWHWAQRPGYWASTALLMARSTWGGTACAGASDLRLSVLTLAD